MKRSAGVGVRIFLPMVGLMGIDWAYGFDKVWNENTLYIIRYK
jgi:outer membrane protein insertion porin family